MSIAKSVDSNYQRSSSVKKEKIPKIEKVKVQKIQKQTSMGNPKKKKIDIKNLIN